MGCFRFGCIYQIHAPKMSALHVRGACSCTVVYLGGSYASGALSAFVTVSRHTTLCMYHLSHCFLLVFVFCLINIVSSSSSSSCIQYINDVPWVHIIITLNVLYFVIHRYFPSKRVIWIERVNHHMIMVVSRWWVFIECVPMPIIPRGPPV